MRAAGLLMVISLGLGCSSAMQQPDAATGGSGGAAGDGGAGTGGGPAADAAAPVDGAPPSGPLVWQSVTMPGIDVQGEVMTIWGSGAELYVGTNDGMMFHRGADGAWTSTKLSTRVEWIWGSGPGDVYACDNSGGTLYHSTGDDVWSPVALPVTLSSVQGIWGPSANEIFVAGGYAATATGAILHLRGGSWVAEPTDNVMRRVWGSSATDLYAIGNSGETLYQSSGDGTWIHKGIGYGRPMTAVWGSGPGDVYVVSSPTNTTTGNAVVAHSKPGGGWTLERGVAVEELLAVWGSGPHDVYVAGRTLSGFFMDDHAVLYHSTGDGQWSAVTVPGGLLPTRIDVVWGASATDVYLGGFSYALNVGTVVHGTVN